MALGLDLAELSKHLRQERLFVTSEREQLQNLFEQVIVLRKTFDVFFKFILSNYVLFCLVVCVYQNNSFRYLKLIIFVTG